MNAIPWLVQVALEGETHARPEWETVRAVGSQAAAVAWLEAHPEHSLPIRLRVGPAAASLRHANGMPMCSREFLVTEAETSCNPPVH